MRARHEVASILRQEEDYLNNTRFNGWQLRTLFALSKCRTAALGGHIDRCNSPKCNSLHLSYNSCRNRHCPKCQGHKTQQWIDNRSDELLPVAYYHVVFTLPSALHRLALYAPKIVYNSLFKAAWGTIHGFGKNPNYIGAQPGMISVLHTWGQNLSLHPHLHCIVPSGGVNKQGKWKHSKKREHYLFPVMALSKVFRAKYTALLRKSGIKDQKLFDELYKKQWVVYTKKPFKRHEAVVAYLGGYTHKIAIDNHRIKGITKEQVVFSAKNYRNGGKKELLVLHPHEFIRRFSLHILPKGFVRMRHYGFLSSTCKRKYLKDLQAELQIVIGLKREITPHRICPKCKIGILKTIVTFDSRGPPKNWQTNLKNNLSKKTNA